MGDTSAPVQSRIEPPRQGAAGGPDAPADKAGEPGPTLLFTAFEPSGDDHASVVIAQLRRRHPDLKIVAWGGPRMEAAGAEIIERTGDDAVMGMPGLAKIREHQRINARIDAWMAANPVTVHIPVDSPAANFPICEIARRHGARIVHLVAPQIWAWGRWRIHKLRRLTDLVLCLLPFEERFFTKREVPARYIGHMLFDEPLDEADLKRRSAGFGEGEPRIAIMPGSRPDELRRNFPLLLGVFRQLKARHPGAAGVVAATGERTAKLLRTMADEHGGWPEGLSIQAADTDAVVYWCQIAIVKSGTVTLQVAKQRRPMVIFYKKSNPLFFLLARVVLSTRIFSLPNLIAAKREIPELIPHFGGPGAIVRLADKLITDPAERSRQIAALDAIVNQFAGEHAAANAADAIEEVAGLREATASG